MRILGVSDKMHWLAHFLWQLIFLFFTCLFLAAILVGGNVLESSTYGFTLLYFLVFGLSVIMFCFSMSSFFSTASVATAFGTLIFFLCFVPYLFAFRSDVYPTLTRSAMLGLCLLPQTCMGLSTRLWVNKEASGTGMSVENMHIKSTGLSAFLISDTRLALALALACIRYLHAHTRTHAHTATRHTHTNTQTYMHTQTHTHAHTCRHKRTHAHSYICSLLSLFL